MRVPIRNEAEGFRFAVGTALGAGVAVVAGAVFEPLIGALVAAFVLFGAVALWLRAPDPDRVARLRQARAAAGPHSGRRVLVVTNTAMAGEALRHAIVRGGRAEVEVLSPVLTSRLHMVTTDIDHELDMARDRLDSSLEWCRHNGIPASGRIGREDVLGALGDELRSFGPDEIIVVTHPHERELPQEHDEVERLRAELDLPVTQVVVERGSASVERA